MQICNKCVLDARYPGIRFDEHGICNLCLRAKDPDDLKQRRTRSRESFEALVQSCRGSPSYDCLLAYSGGKDSTYTLHLLRNVYGLRVVAFSLDNWFQSERALQNIRLVVRNMNVDHYGVTPSFEVVKSLTLASMADDAYSAKALTRASSICTSCISLIRLLGLRLAIEWEVPMLGMGMSPGQAPVPTSVVRTNPGLLKQMQDAFLRPMNERVTEMLRPFLLQERHFEKVDKLPYSINPLAFMDYDEGMMLEKIQQFGWQAPDDTDANSTNCLLNAFANQVHAERFGVNPYASEIAELVRNGSMTREDGLRKLGEPLPTAQITAVKEKLGIR